MPDSDTVKPEAAGRILRSQIEQGWSTQILEMLSRRFIEQAGLSDDYAEFLEDQAKEENAEALQDKTDAAYEEFLDDEDEETPEP